jgi:hypothetical protein
MMRGSTWGERGRVGWRGVLALVGAVLLTSCRDPAAASGTALYVTTEFDPTLLLTQVRVWGSVDGGQSFGPHVLPEQPDRLLHTGETLRILLGEAANGSQARVLVEGLRDNVVLARGEGTTQVRDGYEVDMTVQLASSTPPADEGTFCPGCDGCCYNGYCTKSSFQTCGQGGVACMTCDETRADACDGRGVCVCGTGPACTGVNVDRCDNGQCKCGSSGACGPGQECVNGTCLCTSSSCSGCCAGTTCESGTAKDKCGKGGEACHKCDRTCAPGVTCG